MEWFSDRGSTPLASTKGKGTPYGVPFPLVISTLGGSYISINHPTQDNPVPIPHIPTPDISFVRCVFAGASYGWD